MLVGRPSGGTIIMYKEYLHRYVSIIPSKSKQWYAVRLNHSCNSTLFVNVYMPCDNHNKNNVNIEFSNAIDEIECIINAGSSTRLILCGDWNCGFIQNTAQVNYLLDFIRRFKLHIAWSHTNSMPDHTYVNDSLGHKSHIDHYIVSDNVYHSIDGMHVSL